MLGNYTDWMILNNLPWKKGLRSLETCANLVTTYCMSSDSKRLLYSQRANNFGCVIFFPVSIQFISVSVYLNQTW